MAKISSKTAYPKKKPISSDYFVGTDSEDFNKTVNFGFEEVAGLVNKLNGTPLLNYVFSTSPYLSTEVLLEGRFLSDENELSTPSLTKLYINKFNNSGDNLQELYLFLQANATDFYLKLRNSNNQNNAVYFDISSIEDFPDYFILNITVFKENEFLPLLQNLNVYFFEFELKATSAGSSDPLKLDKSTFNGNAQDLDDRIAILESQTDIDNVFIVKPAFSLASNILTIGSLGRWRLNGVAYTNPASVSFPITFSSTGKTRLVYFVPNNTNGFTQISGTETLGIAIQPQLPNENLYVTYVLVSDSGVGDPVIPPAFATPSLQQITDVGAATTKPITVKDYSLNRGISIWNNVFSFWKRILGVPVTVNAFIDDVSESYNVQFPNKTGGAEETFAMVSDVVLKVDKVTGKGLSTEDYTTSEKNKLASITEIFTTALKSSYDGVVTGYNALIATGSRLITIGEITKLTNTSGTNTGDNATNTQYSGLATSKQDVLVPGTNIKTLDSDTLLGSGNLLPKTELAYALADETTNLTVGTLITFRMPFAMTLSEVRISLNDAPTLSSVVVDVKENGVSIFSTLLSIDANEKTSVTAATPAVISDVNLADDAEITVSTTQIGSGDAGKGLKILFKGRKA